LLAVQAGAEQTAAIEMLNLTDHNDPNERPVSDQKEINIYISTPRLSFLATM
jgi:hypothetical protein